MNPVEAIIRTRCLRGGHFRAGVHHGPEPKDWPPGTFLEFELELLQADPNLVVEVLDAPATGQESEGNDASESQGGETAPGTSPEPGGDSTSAAETKKPEKAKKKEK